MVTSKSLSINVVVKLFLLFFVVAMVSGCKQLKSINSIYNKDVTVEKYTFGDKSLAFIPIVHFGQEEFYNKLRDEIVSLKSEGYTVFYEEIGNKEKDSEKRKNYVLKWRKINGSVGKDRASYDQLSETFKGGIVQPEYEELGVDENDLNADVGLNDLIDKYEEIYGEVKLDDCDLSTDLEAEYGCGTGLGNDLEPVILHYRNEEVAEIIASSELDKIILVYGQDHIKGVKEILNKKKSLIKQ